jgi:formate hydrogenlyase transcriptional activator
LAAFQPFTLWPLLGVHRGLASERYARFWMSRGNEEIARLYLFDTYHAFQRWGAKGKLRELEREYAHMLLQPGPEAVTTPQTILSTIVKGSEALDLSTVLKASQVISGEIVLSKLLEKLMKIALENAGAQKGILILEKEGERSIEAEAVVNRGQITVRILHLSDVDAGSALPQTVANYVRRTRDSVVLSDATTDRRFAGDDYIVDNRPKSILCMPILNQGKRSGILYFENNLTTGAFKPDRIQVMQMLCAQAAISLENAQLYEEMKQEAARRRQAEERERALLEINNAIISNLTQASLLQAIFHALRNAVPFDWCGIFLYDPDKKLLRLIALESVKPSTHFTVGFQMTVGEGNAGWAFNHQKYSLRRDLAQERRYESEQLLFSEGIRSLCVAPMIVRGESIGSLGVLSETSNKYSETDGDFLQEVATQVALAVANMRSYEEIAALKAKLEAENIYLQEEIRTEHNFQEIVGNSPALLALLRKVEQIAATDSTALILGETGTGKEMIARAIHDRSTRKGRPLVKVNCSAISAGLVESELFGHVKGAFTGAIDRRAGRFELADGGTIFLDEVGELTLDTQVKLLRVLQEQEFEPVGSSQSLRVNVRIIAATNRDLEEEVRLGRFRSDLFYRLNVLPLFVPPLRDRRTDIPQLVTFFIERFSRKFGKAIKGIPQSAMEALTAYAWPGNIRELQNVIERSVVLSEGSVLALDQTLVLKHPIDKTETKSPVTARGLEPVSPAASLEEVERRHIHSVLAQTGGVVEGAKGAARILDLHPNTLRSRMKKLGITAAAAK